MKYQTSFHMNIKIYSKVAKAANRTFFQGTINYTRLKYSAKGIRAEDLAEWIFTWITRRL